jgi:hypothetical protein
MTCRFTDGSVAACVTVTDFISALHLDGFLPDFAVRKDEVTAWQGSLVASKDDQFVVWRSLMF